MFAVVALLNEEADVWVKSLWKELEENCDLKGIISFPIPHFTLVGAESFDLTKIQSGLQRVCLKIPPFNVETAGLGIFTGESPVIYLSVVKSLNLMNFHQQICQDIWNCENQPNSLYSPEAWVPHITLALLDVTVEKISGAISDLAFRNLSRTIFVDRLAIIYHESDKIGIHSIFPLEGKR